MSKNRRFVDHGVVLDVPLRRVLHVHDVPPAIDLAGRDLRARDLSSLDLRGANLRRADLRGARTGLSASWRLRLAFVSLLASIAVGALSGIAGQHLSRLITSPVTLERYIGITVTVELLLFLSVAMWKGLYVAVRRVLIPVTVCAAVLVVGGAAAGGTGAAGAAIIAFSILIFAIVSVGTLAHSVAHTTGLLLLLVIALSGTLTDHAFHGGLASTALALSALVLGRRALRGDPGLPILSRLSRRVACSAGTSLRDADLRGAQLQGCTLRCTDLRGAKLDESALADLRVWMCELDAKDAAALAQQAHTPAPRGEQP